VYFLTHTVAYIGGIVFGRFLSFFLSLSAALRENGWTDLHEIFRKVWSDHGTT